MSNFSERFARFLDIAQEDMAKGFQFQRDAMVAGRWVAMKAWFDLANERKVLGLVPTGNITHSFEYCMFIPVEKLDGEKLEEFLSYITQAHNTLVHPDSEHEFTMVSLVIATDGPFERELNKRIRDFSLEVHYKPPKNGWSTVRVAAVDLAHGKITVNRLGSALADRLKPTVKRLK